MFSARTVLALAFIDGKNVVRDPLLRWMILFPLLLGILVRWGTPLLSESLRDRYGFDLAPYMPLFTSSVLISLPMISGMVIGFLLLDQRDDHTLAALQVTPLSLSGYLAYRLAMPMALSVAMTLLVLPLTGLADWGLSSLAMAALAAAPLAPFYALLLGALAANKVQGFALTKASGILLVVPVAAWFVDGPWQWLFGIVPLYWPSRLGWIIDAGGEGGTMVFGAGMAVQSAIILVLLRKFRSVAAS